MDDYLDIFGQQPFLTINIQACFCFPVADTSSHDLIVKTLATGLERLYESFPWLSGEVINEGSGQGDSGDFKFKPLENVSGLVVKDYRHDPEVPNMTALRDSKFPMRLLDENALAPRKIFERGKSQTAPVFLIQANFVTGGLLLTFLAQHNTMDATGLAQVIRLFSKACSNERFTDDELLCNNLPRRDIVPLLPDSFEPSPELDRYLVSAAPSSKPPTSQRHLDPRCTWACFTFPASALTALKARAAASLAPEHFVSTDDAITAFIWQSVARARIPRLETSTSSTIMRAVNVRHHLGLPSSYPGPIQSNVYTSSSLQSLVDEPLGSVALRLRSALEPTRPDLAHRTREIATFLSRTRDKTAFSFVAKLDLSSDVILSSWAKLNVHDLDFNLGLGMPEAVRKPHCEKVEGLMFLMPKTLEGDLSAALCLRDEDLERLKEDSDFAVFGEHVG